MKDLQLNGMRELSFKEVEDVSGGLVWFLAPKALKWIAGGVATTLGLNLIYGSGEGQGPRGPTPAGPPRR